MGDLTRSDISQARRLAQPLLSLDGYAVSSEAKALVSHLLNRIVLPSLPPQRPTSVESIGRALGATLAGLVAAAGAEWGDGWLRRPLSKESYSTEPVSRVQFLKVLTALEAAGLVQIIKGVRGGERGVAPSIQTRVRLSETGRELAVSSGVTLGNARSHFDLPIAEDPVEVDPN